MVVVEAFEFIPSISCYRIIYRISHPFILDILTSLFYWEYSCITIS